MADSHKDLDGIYGSWLDKSYDYAPVKNRLDTLNSEFFPKFKKRSEAIETLATIFVEDVEKNCPELKGKLTINYADILAMVGRYFNDIVHYKIWHQIAKTEPAKMVSHFVKWGFVYTPISANLDSQSYKCLSSTAKETIFTLKDAFLTLLIKYIIDGFPNISADRSQYDKIFYLLHTGQYDSKNITLLFDEIF